MTGESLLGYALTLASGGFVLWAWYHKSIVAPIRRDADQVARELAATKTEIETKLALKTDRVELNRLEDKIETTIDRGIERLATLLGFRRGGD